MVVSVFLSGCSLLDNLLFTKSEVPEFSFSGYVRADGKPLEGATVDCGVSKVTTNEQGYYSFSKINRVVQVIASKEGFLFGDELVFVNSLSTDVNFYGYELFDKAGVVKNNDVVISNVKIVAESSNGKFETTSNEMGEFYLSDLAGQVKVTATKENYNFFTQSFTIDKEDAVVITGMTDLQGSIVVDSAATPSDFVLKCNDKVINILDDLTFVAQNVEPGDKLFLTSDKFFVKNEQIKIGSTESIVFDCQKYFDITGTVSCGTKKLNDVKVYFGKDQVKSVDGKFSFSKVHGKKELRCMLEGFEFESVIVSAENPTINISATTDVTVQANLDVGSDYSSVSIKIGERVFGKPTSTGKYVLNSVKFGDKIKVVSDNYFAMSDVIIESKNLTVDLQRYYSAKIVALLGGQSLSGVDVYVDDVKYTTAQNGLELNKLYGSHRVRLECEGYKFVSEYTINYYQNKVNAECYKLFGVTGSVKSADIVLNNARIKVNGQNIECVDGSFEIDDLYGLVELGISAEGYNSKKIIASIDNNQLDINLDYDITGVVLCGDNKVAGVNVTCEDLTVTTDSQGCFELKGLAGQNQITFQKDYYTFQSETVTSSKHLQVNTTYYVAGNVSGGDGNVGNLEIIIISKTNSENILTTTTDESGNYRFENLSGSYMLSYGETTLSLKPKMYNISGGDSYNFSDKGFGFGGVVTCGGLPLADVNVQIGTLKTTTDAEGKYSFPLVAQGGILTLSKTGYSFENNGKDITEEVDERKDINFVATYKVVLNVKSGKTSLSRVVVKVNNEIKGQTNESGMLEVLGLTGTNQIELSLTGYKFQGVFEIGEYASLDYLATFDIVATICTGDISVQDVYYMIGGTDYATLSDANGKLTIRDVKLGDEIKFVKDGYLFDTYVVSEYVANTKILGRYKISGIVSNCGTEISGVVVSIEGTDESTITDSHGYFEFDGVEGQVNLVLSKSGFDFDKVPVSSADKLNIMSKYSIAGVISLASGTAVSRVDIYIGDKKVATTDNNGKFKIEGLTSAVTLKCVRLGYKFVGDLEITAPTNNLKISATYSILGRVVSGKTPVAGALITASNGMTTTTGSDGTYILEGIDSEVYLKCEQNSFDTSTSETISGYTTTADFKLTYTVTITIDGDFGSISVVVAGDTNRSKNYSVKQIIIDNLSGENEVTLSKKSYKITPTDKFNVNGQFDIELKTTLVYNVSGKVLTESGAPIKNAQVFAGDKSVRTNASGEYTITDLVGKNNLKAVLPYWNDESNATHELSLDKTYGQIEKTGTYNIVISNKNFAVAMVNYSYAVLHNSNGYQVDATGTVKAKADAFGIESDNSLKIRYKQDKNGVKLYTNQNIGDVVSGADIDPNGTIFSCFDLKNKVAKYKLVQGKGKNISSSDSWDAQNLSFDNYRTGIKMSNGVTGGSGIGYDGFTTYTIDFVTAKSANSLRLSGGDYIFTLVLDANNGNSYANYKQQMTVMCEKKDLNNFSKIELDYVISQDGYIKSTIVHENYRVTTNNKCSGMYANQGANVVGTITYTFDIDINGTSDTIFDLTSPYTALQGLNKVETYSSTQTLNSKPVNIVTCKTDMIFVKKEELL